MIQKPDLAWFDFDQNPFVVIWETTRACALKCVHCRAEAIDNRNPGELTTEQAFLLLDEIRRFGTPPPVSSRQMTGPIALQSQETGGGGNPLVVLTGGDPLRRPDAKEIVRYGARFGLRMAMTPSGTGEVTFKDIEDLKKAGLARLAVSLDGPDAPIHDFFRKVDGSFKWTLNIIRWANELNLSVQINTTITRHNQKDFDALAKLLESFNIALWSVFFLVPVGRGRLADEITATEYEAMFHQMADLARRSSFDVKSTEAPHYRRVLIQRRKEANEISHHGIREGSFTWINSSRQTSEVTRSVKGVNDGKGFVFISHTGEIWPSGFLPISAGNVKKDSLVDVYRNSDVFRTLRDTSKLKGKCGACEYRTICGGSRARAWSIFGDYMESDPFCVYVPKGYEIAEEEKRFW